MMLALRTIRDAIAIRLKSKYPAYKVHFDHVKRSDAPYFYVEMYPHASSLDDTYSDRRIGIDIQLVLAEDACGRIHRVDLYDAADTLDALIRPVMQIGDRYITIQDTETTFVDEVLHYIFELLFTDAFTDAEVGGIQYELMQELDLNLNKGEN